MVWRNAAKVILAAGEALTKAFTRAVRDEIRASKQAAARYAERTGGSASEAQRSGETNARLGISLQESMQILNVKEPLNKEEVESHYKHLFEINDKRKGGSLYLQSKVFRAKERIDEEFARSDDDTEPPIQEAKEVKNDKISEEDAKPKEEIRK